MDLVQKIQKTSEAMSFETVSDLLYTQYKVMLLTQERTITQCINGKDIIIDQIKVNSLLQPPPFASLSKVRIGKSRIHGRGVFANVDIKETEIVTFYPADMVMYNTKPFGDDVENVSLCFLSERCKLHLESKTECQLVEECLDYRVNVDKHYSIQAHPSFAQDANFLGHFINDGCIGNMDNMSATEYSQQQPTTTNCFFAPTKGGLGVTVLATKYIPKDSELFTSYGFPYWMSLRTKKAIGHEKWQVRI